MIELSLNDSFYLRSITASDLEDLRKWKNKYRDRFFHKEIINHEQQSLWFSNYLEDEKNLMFIVVENSKKIGCMGFRDKGNFIDVYNVIRGEESQVKMFSMSDAFKLMLHYVVDKYRKKITCQVLNDNPAFDWYLNNEFSVLKVNESYSLLEYQPKKIFSDFKIKEVVQ